MTEETIIDGVDVSECEYYQIEANELYPKAQYCGSMRNTFCENEPNCYYKQLKRLQETLKHTENGRKEKANKLKRIEEIVMHCIQGGFTDEFIQEIFDICREHEEV